MMQINLSSPCFEEQVKRQRGKEQNTACGRPNTGLPVYRMPYTVYRFSHFCLLTFAFCLLTCSFSFAAERPHLITRWENYHDREWHA